MVFSNATPVLHGAEHHRNEGRRSQMSTSTSNGSQLGAALKHGGSFTRTTVGKRVLRYFLEVHQQPAGARVCIPSLKSSADWRPLDPPPILSLRIFEERNGVQTDITVSYDATLFLVATLDFAKPVATGRLSHVMFPSPIPVLTGIPVAGANYLDRPHEALWFVFSDLGVRHEGRYTLSFHLYETSKNRDDCDRVATDAALQLSSESDNQPASPCSEVRWRMEVESTVFTVDSAKRFPGLGETTALSRTLAEQGVRVRTRHKIRIRIGSKRRGDYDDFEGEYIRPRRTPIPEPDHGSYVRDRHIESAAERQPYSQGAVNMAAKAEQEVLKPMAKVVPRPLAVNIWGLRTQAPFGRQPSPPFASSGPLSPVLPPTSTIELSAESSSGTMENLVPGEMEVDLVKDYSTIMKESIWWTFVESLRFMVGTDYHIWSALGSPIPPVDDEPQSHAAKRASKDWWLAHPSEPWENILPPSHIASPRHLFSVILSSWHQDLEASSQHIRDDRNWSDFLSSSPQEQEAKVIEQLVNDISVYMDRTSAGSVKRSAGGSSTSNATSGTGLASSSSATRYQTSKITGKRTGRGDAASDDDGSNDDRPNENDRSKRIRKNVAQYSRYVICTEFAAEESTVRFSCYWGGWPTVDRLKQDHLVKVHCIDASKMKIEKGGTEAEKWWRLFEKLHPGRRDAHPEVFIPGPFFEDRVAQNTYNKVFSEAMKSVERIQQRNAQSLASAIHGLVHTHRDHERREIRQVVVDILHARTGSMNSNALLGDSERTKQELANSSQDVPSSTRSAMLYSGVHHQGHAFTTSSAIRDDSPPSVSNINEASRMDSLLSPALDTDRNFADTPNQIIMSAQSPFIGTADHTSDMIRMQHDVHAMTTTPSSETLPDTATVRPASHLDAQQFFLMTVCRCIVHSANCDSCKQNGAEFCIGCSGWFSWSAYAEPFLLR